MAKVICIEQGDDGQFSVGEEPQGQDESMPEGQEGPEPGMQPAKNLDDALEMARSMFDQGPSAEDQEGEQAFNQGFNEAASGGSMLLRKGM